ncbi:lipopolysaccharide assembly protein LapA domain-containing protein [Deinococcus maricopensis]|uniref:Lipopolysaccharide assembly protein A domain-containing protein n=1 Tax=Deinococcus maricopensis (strain DSM 21211 / LMG 22137 / NRRL B-23946 / LB-34) TaxID=709986 RepID=E8U9G5_DEIML|nr:lipopolysaccharide assembly protein LapA domain-containing protein [Deinococcus maricopensis]ADV67704.1 hypothetical protein Deima_2061 [Deinococcus maricopensis DSM 21211]
MRVVQFVQVIVLLLLGAYVLLLQLQNPVRVTLPLPFGLNAMNVPLGVLVALTLLVGVLYSALLFVPRLLLARARRARAARATRALEERLNATLRAKLAAPATRESHAAVTAPTVQEQA